MGIINCNSLFGKISFGNEWFKGRLAVYMVTSLLSGDYIPVTAGLKPENSINQNYQSINDIVNGT